MAVDPQKTPDPAETPPRAGRRRMRGQSVAEFALILPLMLAFLGLSIDFARVFQAWLTLESATRDAAEAAATNASSSGAALTIARRTVCLQAQNVPGFTPSASPSPNDIEQCTSPSVNVPSFTVSTTSPGATTTYPIGSATVRATLPFRPIFGYPVITQNGTWTIGAQGSFSIVQGRR